MAATADAKRGFLPGREGIKQAISIGSARRILNAKGLGARAYGSRVWARWKTRERSTLCFLNQCSAPSADTCRFQYKVRFGVKSRTAYRRLCRPGLIIALSSGMASARDPAKVIVTPAFQRAKPDQSRKRMQISPRSAKASISAGEGLRILYAFPVFHRSSSAQ